MTANRRWAFTFYLRPYWRIGQHSKKESICHRDCCEFRQFVGGRNTFYGPGMVQEVNWGLANVWSRLAPTDPNLGGLDDRYRRSPYVRVEERPWDTQRDDVFKFYRLRGIGTWAAKYGWIEDVAWPALNGFASPVDLWHYAAHQRTNDPVANLGYTTSGRGSLNRTAIRYGDVERRGLAAWIEGHDGTSNYAGWSTYDNPGISLMPLMEPGARFTRLIIDWSFLWVVRTKAGAGCWVWPPHTAHGFSYASNSPFSMVNGGPFRYVWLQVWAEIVSNKDLSEGGASAAGRVIMVKYQAWRIKEWMMFGGSTAGHRWNRMHDPEFQEMGTRTKWSVSAVTRV